MSEHGTDGSMLYRYIGRDQFGVVLALLLGGYLLQTLAVNSLGGVVVALLYVGALVAAVVASRPAAHAVRVVGVGLIVVCALTGISYLAFSHPVEYRVRRLAVAFVLACTLTLVMHRVLVADKVGIQVLSGALSSYLLIGLMFAQIFGAVAGPHGAAFFASHVPANPQDLQYFSFTTLTTLGYGDLTAAADPGRGLATLEAMLGQIFLATLIARLVSRYERRPRLRRPPDAPSPSAERDEHSGDD